ncbi:MAG: plastocyanin/azurin family copper-binding protein [Actinomycetota bacterium]|nr:plastocyanin/azurin family copper-binding protein [Actinomycetota bacterium]
MKTRSRVLLALSLIAFAACDERVAPARPAKPERAERARAGRAPRPRRVDPRRGGLEVVLGEWAVTPEAEAIRPGRVTFVVHNRGTMGHGFEIELEGDSSGPGSGDLFEAEGEVLEPGESARMTVTLPPGTYEIECLVDGHDDMGMEGVLEVRDDAPLIEAEESSKPGRIAIRDFAFAPSVARVPRGTQGVWHNDDPAEHTVTSADGSFGSDTLAAGTAFSHRFAEPGVHEYRCAIHPEMKGKVKVE